MGTSGKSKYRHSLNESMLLNCLNNALKYDINDELLKHVSFTYVKLSGDKSYLNVYVDTWDQSKMDKIIEHLNNARGVFRTALATKTNFYKVPNIGLKPDATIQQNLKIEEL